MVFRQLISKMVFPNMEKELSRTVGKEVAKMECVHASMAPQVYGYRSKISSLGGAFGSTVAPRQQHAASHQSLLQRVDIPFKPNQGLFHE
mmetsp:Transcript_8754/g.19644  ORF Transcript_8754/g.19644 Transcript_8754/m.19644 type:complete len:90 (+) Transcript_8754:109-378(+)|eukprot:g4883.t1 g4883   contig18:139568-140007(+)